MASHKVPVHSGLARRRLGVLHIFFFTVAASAPLTVLGGGVTTTFAVTGIIGTPLSFLIIAIALAIFAVGYSAMSRHVSNAGAFYAYLANGLGRSWGVAGSFVALLAYNAIQICLFGLFGAGFGEFMAQKAGIDLAWWVWAYLAMAVVAVLGVLRVDLNATVLAVLLILECLAVALFDLGAFTHPADGAVSTAGLDPGNLFVTGVGAVFAFGIAAFVGFESAAIYSEECKDPRRTVARATYSAVAFTGIFYALSAWALTVSTGPENVVAASAEAGPGVIFGALTEYFGTVVADIANVLFVTSVFAALLSFHNAVSRYLFALGRERVLPQFLGRAGVTSGAPVAGSITQTLTAAVVVGIFVVLGRDPILELFTWFSSIAAVAVLTLMAGTSAAVVGFFSKRRTEESVWQRVIAPSVATVLLAGIVGLVVYNFDLLLGTEGSSPLRWILPGLVLVAAVAGLVWGLLLRGSKPDVYEGIGRNAIAPRDAESVDRIPVG